MLLMKMKQLPMNLTDTAVVHLKNETLGLHNIKWLQKMLDRFVT